MYTVRIAIFIAFFSLASIFLSSVYPSRLPLTRSTQSSKQSASQTYGRPLIVGSLKDPAIIESSGLTASRISPGVYWTHNDSGDGPYIFALNARGGALGVWRVTGAQNKDWEDIASGPGPQPGKSYLYVGDIGDNSEARSDVVIYRISEPAVGPTTVRSKKTKPLPTEPAEAFRLRYPDGKHDAEALLVHPQTGNLYIVTKVLLGDPGVYELPAPLTAGVTNTLKRIGTLDVPSLLGGFITGGSVSPDGTRVALCDYFQGYELVLPRKGSSFDDIWKQRMVSFDLGRRSQGEGIAYRSDGSAILATSEGRYSPLIQVARNR